ncbi:hypothetical protein [Mycobacterium sp. E3339]|uniref:hypothetical protein n=1 Tax=Mycobacterium sp. E3339 TaxID=1834146 RepID=UPI000AD00F06|nr:hypothetical protein [Mycobacterium sp. E3339]
MLGQYRVLPSPGVVEMWSAVRLPFEPHGWKKDMRDELRRALQDLSRPSSGRLHAVYCAADDDALVDTENVLFYNVGGTALRSLMTRAVTFERNYDVPQPPPGTDLGDSQTLHYQRYREASDNSFEFWKPGRQLAAFCGVPVDSIAKPAPVWKAVRDYATPPTRTADAPTRFLIKVQITDMRKSGHAGSIVSKIKPALDGIISAYHSHDGDGAVEARRLEEVKIGTAEALRHELLDPRWATLGPRRLLWPHRPTGVQWNPADDYCVAAHVTLSRDKLDTDKRSARWRLTAELMEATHRKPVVPRTVTETPFCDSPGETNF